MLNGNDWSPAWTIRTLLLAIQAMLSSIFPNDEDDVCLNEEAGLRYLENRLQFRQVARAHTAAMAVPRTVARLARILGLDECDPEGIVLWALQICQYDTVQAVVLLLSPEEVQNSMPRTTMESSDEQQDKKADEKNSVHAKDNHCDDNSDDSYSYEDSDASTQDNKTKYSSDSSRTSGVKRTFAQIDLDGTSSDDPAEKWMEQLFGSNQKETQQQNKTKDAASTQDAPPNLESSVLSISHRPPSSDDSVSVLSCGNSDSPVTKADGTDRDAPPSDASSAESPLHSVNGQFLRVCLDKDGESSAAAPPSLTSFVQVFGETKISNPPKEASGGESSASVKSAGSASSSSSFVHVPESLAVPLASEPPCIDDKKSSDDEWDTCDY